MIEIHTLIAISIVCLFGMMSPGPNFIAVCHKSVNESRKNGLIFSMGISIISASWAAATLFGMSLLFSLIPWLFMFAKVVGGLYLIYLGYKIITKSKALEMNADVVQKSKFATMKEGMLTNLANPKSMVFYASVFSTSVPQGSSNMALLIVIAIVGIISLSWYSFMAVVFSSKKILRHYLRYKKQIENFCGGFLILFGIKQIMIRS